MTRLLLTLATLTLAACSGSFDPQDADPTSLSNSADELEALPPKLREIALYRAIRDAGQSCNRIVNIWQLPSRDGRSRWQVRCDSSGDNRIQLAPDGTAQVTSLLVP